MRFASSGWRRCGAGSSVSSSRSGMGADVARVTASMRSCLEREMGPFTCLVSPPPLPSSTPTADESPSQEIDDRFGGGGHGMWASVPAASPEAKVPGSRSKHASILHGQYMYLLGGRNGNVPLKDFWRYNIADNHWEQVRGDGDPPSCLQDHTMVGYKDELYVFGGEVGFSNGVETPLWIYSIKSNSWRKFVCPKGVVTPKGRRSHTATVYQDSMYIYGGYQDLRGSTSELWAFHFESETWHLVSQGGAVDGPPARHRHSAVLHDSAMWVFGGMTDLQERSDFWRFDFVSRRWRPVKSKPGPGCLHSHCAVKFLSVMLLFGGEREGQTLNEMWRFHFATEFWEKLTFVDSQPMPRAQTTAFIFSQFTTRTGTVHYMGLPEQEYSGVQPEPMHQQTRNSASTRLRRPRSPEGQRYTFGRAESYTDEPPTSNQPEVWKLEQIPKEIMRDMRRPSHFQRLESGGGASSTAAPAATSSSSSSTSTQKSQKVLKDLSAKMISQVNISARLSSSGHCSYSMFSNESTESINTTTASESSAAGSGGSPCSVRRMRAARSSQELLNLDLADALPSVPTQDARKHNSSSSDSTPKGSITRISTTSVPNFRSLMEAQQKADAAEAAAISQQPQGSTQLPSSGGTSIVRSDSACTFNSYDLSSRSSTLSNGNGTNGSGDPSRPRLGKSTSVNPKLIDLLEEETAREFYSSDEFSSLSGYESIEAEDDSDRMSFANPHYLGPDVQSILEKGSSRSTAPTAAPAHLMTRDESHQSFAQALNSPADSLFSDYQDFHARLNKDFVELNEATSSGSKRPRPKSAYVQSDMIAATALMKPPPPSTKSASPPSTNGNAAAASTKRTRPLSAEYASHPSTNRVGPSPQPTSGGGSCNDGAVCNDNNELLLLLYLIGGREVGQVTVFKRPISIWRLDLTKTF